MDLQFLGTSSGVPTKARNVSATAVIEASGTGWYLVDCGEGTQHQLLHSPLSVRDLRAILITHVHGDHCFGLPGLLASAGMSGRKEPLQLVLPADLQTWVRQSLAVSDTYLPFELQMQPVETFTGLEHGNVQIGVVELSHRVPSYGFVFEERDPEPRLDTQRLQADGIPAGPMWGQLARGRTVEHEGRQLDPQTYLQPTRPAQRIIVCGDNDRPELLSTLAANVDVLVHEATFTQPVVERTQATFGHSTAAAVARFAETAGVRNLVLTHFSARYQSGGGRGGSIEEVREEAQAHYNGHLTLARDLQRYRLGRDGVVVEVE
ncbi:ribonuclease Z [Pseudomonas mosselii]|uniref:Ribonuclease Z n=1 Tax=Pseudomonas mosselii TaxID=78327 RepID=A0A7W2JY91_9PSED|nr:MULTISPECIES: ribonuclease Z [Pseudomonas]MBA6067389.1 ribonuclease Z [Pseudomonas mosselii]MBC3459087.1 ribonuclease Z [Pseudomonas mosselii]MBH3310094.1 ribonuclease Z [Pseudomonas mosselii]MBH3326760.1 ribonuclease Z [Pseudomonas mosselii]MCH7420124.1 ribonuclease Z [Pseudomonas mosselii]